MVLNQLNHTHLQFLRNQLETTTLITQLVRVEGTGIAGKVLGHFLPPWKVTSLSSQVSSRRFNRNIRGRAGLFLLFPDTPHAIPEDEQRHGTAAPVIFSLTGESKWIGQFAKLILMPTA
jgi:hypothetical protein